jgi:hypothetical protein
VLQQIKGREVGKLKPVMKDQRRLDATVGKKIYSASCGRVAL